MRLRGTGLLLLVLLVPACGGGGGDGPSPVVLGAPPSATVATPAGTRHTTVPIDFTLTDAESNPISISVFYSTDGGGSYLPAKPSSGNGPVTGLNSSPGGTVHTFLWNSYDDAVGLGAVNLQVRFRVLPSDGNPGAAGSTSNFTVDNTNDRAVGVATALFPHTLTDMGTKEMALGDLIADAMKARYGVQLALQNGWGCRSTLPATAPDEYLPANLALRRPQAGYAAGPPYDLVQGDFGKIMPFGNRVITRTITGAQLWTALEHGFALYPSNFNGFPQIAVFSVSFSQGAPAGSRVLSVTLQGGGAIPNDGTLYTFATNDFINGGGDGYTVFAGTPGTVQERLHIVVADYVQGLGSVSPGVAGRITIAP